MQELISKAAYQVPFLVALSIFGLSSALHLIFSFLELEMARKVTKMVPTLSLAFACLFFSLTAILPALCFLFSSLGDLLMLKKNKKMGLAIGGFAFFFGHCAGVAFLLTRLPINVEMAITILILFYSLAFLFGERIAQKLTKMMYFRIAGVVYFATLLLLLILFIVTGFAVSPVYFMGLGGMVLFILSDSLIVVHAAVKPVPKRHFVVMLTYLLAQALLASSYLFGILG